MAKNIVICCDGTGNEVAHTDTYSNVVKLYACLDVGGAQRAYYHPGVGTMGSPTARGRVGQTVTKYLGLGFGLGLMRNVSDAYRYLMDTYEDGDRIFLFGFSRGAYTIRVLAGLIHVFGLLCPGNQQLIPYIFRMFKMLTKQANRQQASFAPYDAFKQIFSHKETVRVHFCGLWDTVSSYGWVYSPVELPFEGRNEIIRTIRHALALDERRSLYTCLLWGAPFAGQDVKQVWFTGAHSDVGGSYPERESGLSKISLEWMLTEARQFGLVVDDARAEQVLGDRGAGPLPIALPSMHAPDANGPVHDELITHPAWNLLEYIPRRDAQRHGKWYLPRGRGRILPADACLHSSVTRRTAQPRRAISTSSQPEPWQPFQPLHAVVSGSRTLPFPAEEPLTALTATLDSMSPATMVMRMAAAGEQVPPIH